MYEKVWGSISSVRWAVPVQQCSGARKVWISRMGRVLLGIRSWLVMVLLVGGAVSGERDSRKRIPMGRSESGRILRVDSSYVGISRG